MIRKIFFKNNGQNLSEYAIVIALVAAFLTTMQVYSKRTIQGLIKISADQLGPQENGIRDQRNQDKGILSEANIVRKGSFDKEEIYRGNAKRATWDPGTNEASPNYSIFSSEEQEESGSSRYIKVDD